MSLPSALSVDPRRIHSMMPVSFLGNGPITRQATDITPADVEGRMLANGYAVYTPPVAPSYTYATKEAAIDASLPFVWGQLQRAHGRVAKSRLSQDQWNTFRDNALGIAQRNWLQTV